MEAGDSGRIDREMKKMFEKLTDEMYDALATLAFHHDNEGYRPNLIESPDGDGIWDTEKKFGHLAPKYKGTLPEAMYADLIDEAAQICEFIGIPFNFWPSIDSTIRVLHYPPGAVTAPHTDFCLFTMMLYRDDMSAFRYLSGRDEPLLTKALKISPGIHFGELMTEILGVEATRHEVVATEDPQRSAVFFVMPPLNAVLPSGLLVSEWLDERKGRSRKVG